MLPLGIRARQKIEAAVCDALSAAGGQPVSVPLVRSAEQAAAVLSDADSRPIRFRDRAGREMVIEAGHEGAVLAAAEGVIQSYNSFLSCCTRPGNNCAARNAWWEGCSAPRGARGRRL